MVERRRARRIAVPWIAVAGILACAWMTASGASPGGLTATVDGEGATVGDRIPFRLCLAVPEGASFEPQAIGPELGPFTLATGGWTRASDGDGGCDWAFVGTIAAYETGAQELPAVAVRVVGADGPIELRTDPVELTIDSVLPPDDDATELDIADIKDPLSIPPDHGPLVSALIGLGALLAVAGLVWWLHRRFAERLTAAPTAPDPFSRMSPDEWAFQALKALLARRLHEHGRVDEFHAEVARILKRYLGGRFRVDLLECTTAEVGPSLRPTGADTRTISHAADLLGRCDAVKFARERPDASKCRELVEEAYGLIDATRPPSGRAAPESAA